jgi:uncharacterized protein
MKTRWLITLLVVFTLAIPAFGQTSPTEEKTANVRRLLTLIGAEKIQASMFDQFMNIFKSSFARTAKPDERTQKVLDRMTVLIAEELKKVDFTQLYVDLYSKNFTNDEIKELIQFYESPVGRKTIQTLPAVTQEAMTRGAELGQIATKRALERMAQEFPELGPMLNAAPAK